jgi:hypothetical protein
MQARYIYTVSYLLRVAQTFSIIEIEESVTPGDALLWAEGYACVLRLPCVNVKEAIRLFNERH